MIMLADRVPVYRGPLSDKRVTDSIALAGDRSVEATRQKPDHNATSGRVDRVPSHKRIEGSSAVAGIYDHHPL
jgi:hypothetical protein